jgi:hypothetical protein
LKIWGRGFGDAAAAGSLAGSTVWVIFALVPSQLGAAPHRVHMEPARSAAAFIDSIGVQTHINYVDTPYAQWNLVQEELVRLGIHHVRDALPMKSTFVEDYRELAAEGIHCTCGLTATDVLTQEGIVHAAEVARDVEALEAPNECDAGKNCGGGGARGVARVTAMLPLLSGAAHKLGVPLIGPSFTRAEAYASTGPIGHWIGFNNLHVYFGGRNPGTEGWGAGDAEGHRYGSIDWWLDQSHVNAPGVPSLITETGYEAFDLPSRAGTVPLDIEASYLVRTLLLAWNYGIPRTFIYELLDEFPGSGYGLLRHDFREKPAYTELRNLLLLLSTPTDNSAPQALEMTFTGGDASVCHTLLQEKSGSYDLIVWLEKPGYDAVAQRRIQVPGESVRIQLSDAYGVKRVVVFKDDGSIDSRAASTFPSSVDVNVTGNLSVLHIVAHAKGLTAIGSAARHQRLPS